MPGLVRDGKLRGGRAPNWAVAQATCFVNVLRGNEPTDRGRAKSFQWGGQGDPSALAPRQEGLA
jgi:hypothetical protein